jgi:uncharacterized delta-60 repeat protein
MITQCSLRGHLVALIFALFTPLLSVKAQTMDPTFTPYLGGASIITSMAVQDDNKVIIAGTFTGFGSTKHQSNLVRLNADGTIDETFESALKFRCRDSFLDISDMLIQPNGKIMICGNFSAINNETHEYVARLNADGTLDDSFHSGIVFGIGTFYVASMALQADGKILLTGRMDIGAIQKNLLRLNTDGSVDESFTTNFDAATTDVFVQNDGKIIVTGAFTSVQNIAREELVRLEVDGSLDETFPPHTVGSSSSSHIYKIDAQSDGKLILAGEFTSFDGQPVSDIVRLNTDGTLDTSFVSDQGFGLNARILDIEILSDNRIAIGGEYTATGVTMLTAAGEVDSTFEAGGGVSGGLYNPQVRDIAVDSLDRVVFSGDFTSYDTTPILAIARVSLSGIIDNTFIPNPMGPVDVHAVLPLSDGSTIVAGNFVMVNGEFRNCIVKLNSNGTTDNTFSIPGNLPASVQALAQQDANTILIAGEGNHGLLAPQILRVTTTGAIDNTFSIPDIQTHLSSDGIYTMHVQADNKIIIGGGFDGVDGTSLYNLARLNADGTFDASFHPGREDYGDSERIVDIQVRSSDKSLLLMIDHELMSGGQGFIAMADSLGTRLTAFDNVGTKFTDEVDGGIFLPNGKIMLGGPFYQYDGIDADHLVVIDDAGVKDSIFNLKTPLTHVLPLKFTLLGDDKVLVGMQANYGLPQYMTGDENYLEILDLNGYSFSPMDVRGTVSEIILENSGNIHLGGGLRQLNGTTVSGVARLTMEVSDNSIVDSLKVSFQAYAQTNLSWTFNSTQEIGFEIQRSIQSGSGFTTIGYSDKDSLTFIDTSVLNYETVYYYRVRAIKLDGVSEFSDVSSVVTPPLAPTITWGTSTHETITVIWSDNSNLETEYRIYRFTDWAGINYPTDEILYAVLDANDTAFVDTNVLPNKFYYYYVVAANASGLSESAYVNMHTLKIPPLAPDSLVATAVTHDMVTLDWRDNSEGTANPAGGFEFERSANDTLHYVSGNTIDLVPQTLYYFRIRAYSTGLYGGSYSGYSNHLAVRTLIPPPVLLNSEATSFSTVKLTWDDTLAHESGFKIYIRDGEESIFIDSVDANVVQYIVHDLEASTEYEFYITAFDEDTESVPSNNSYEWTKGILFGRWTILEVSNIPERSDAVAFSIGGDGYVGLGQNDSGLLKDFWKYDSATNQWSPIAAFPGNARIGAVAFVVNGKAYVGTGNDLSGNGFLRDFYEYDPTANTWTRVADYPESPASGSGITAGAAFAVKNYGYVGLGNNGVNNGKEFYQYNPLENTWTPTAEFPGEGRLGATTFADDTYGYIAMGSTGLTKTNELRVFNTLYGTWEIGAAYPAPPKTGAVTAYLNNQAIVCTGWGNDSQPSADIMEYANQTGWEYPYTAFPGEPRADAVSFVIGKKAYFFSGTNGTMYFKDLLQFEPGLSFLPLGPNEKNVTYHSPTSVKLTWVDIADNEDGFKIECYRDNEFLAKIYVEANTEQFIHEDLEPEHNYVYFIDAYNEYGTSGTNGVSMFLSTPAMPTDLEGESTNPSEITLTWQDHSDIETGFEIFRGNGLENDSLESIVTTSGETFTDFVNPGEAYRYTIRARGEYGSFSAMTDTITVVCPPLTPSTFSGEVWSLNSIYLKWSNNNSFTLGTEVFRSEDGIDFFPIDTVTVPRQNASYFEYTDRNLVANATYWYTVRALGKNGWVSAYADTLEFTTFDRTPVPATQFHVRDSLETQITLVWRDNSDNEKGFHIWRGPNSNQLELLATAGVNDTTFTDTIEPELIYTYAISAFNDLGESSQRFTEYSFQPDIPEPPSNLIVELNNGKIQLSWDDNSAYETAFEINRVDKGDTPFAHTEKNINTYVDLDTDAKLTAYTYKVRSKNGKGASAYSSEVTISQLIITGLELRPETGLLAYPSPVEKFLIVRNVSARHQSFKIVDIQGRVMAKGQLPAGDESVLHCEHWSQGIYLIQGNEMKILKIFKR